MDKSYATAVAKNGTSKEAVTDQPWGDRTGAVVDPSGHDWVLATHKEDLSPEEINKRIVEAMKQMAAGADGAGKPEAKK